MNLIKYIATAMTLYAWFIVQCVLAITFAAYADYEYVAHTILVYVGLSTTLMPLGAMMWLSAYDSRMLKARKVHKDKA